ncbi:HAD family phosphatase [bacterium]|nr:HAD family phosphatase [bacterium]
MSPKRAVLFDLDGVLIDSMPHHISAWQQVLGEIGIQIDSLYIRLHEGEKAEATVGRLLQEHGMEMSDNDLAQLIERKRALYRKTAPQGLIPGARYTVEKMKEAGIRCAIVTGSVRANMTSVLSDDDIALFNPVITAEMYTRGKPHPEPYLKALEEMKLAASDCLVVENAPRGIQSAKAAGIKVAALTVTLPRKYLSEADVICDRHDELLRIVGVETE